MGRSLALGLYLLLAKRGEAGQAASRPARNSGKLLWINLSEGQGARAVIDSLRDHDPNLTILLTSNETDLQGTEADHVERQPQDRSADVAAFLDHWRPDAGLFIGNALPAILITEAHAREIPLFLADIAIAAGELPFWRKGLVGSLVGRFNRILARDAASVQSLRALGGQSLAVELGGRIEETVEPLGCTEAEREEMAQMLHARPVWFAAACPEAEEETVIYAHQHAMQYAHRLLLILSPEDMARGPALASELTDKGLIVAERSRDGEPSPDVQVFITEGTTELGLWYRLAPLTFLGGSLAGVPSMRSPLEPAVLGSAIVVGPRSAVHGDIVHRLAESRALRTVGTPDELATAVSELIAPDRAAALAHNAWAMTTGGAEAAEKLVDIILAVMAQERRTA